MQFSISGDFCKTGTHPFFDAVSLLQLIFTWAESDLDPISQISSVMIESFKSDVGIRMEFLEILKQ